ncbi:MAG: VCBS repeat-containing protein [Acidobacteria bacterium]|nr:VCBS repeat-containing protein [Acidobacteriota bacterium]
MRPTQLVSAAMLVVLFFPAQIKSQVNCSQASIGNYQSTYDVDPHGASITIQILTTSPCIPSVVIKVPWVRFTSMTSIGSTIELRLTASPHNGKLSRVAAVQIDPIIQLRVSQSPIHPYGTNLSMDGDQQSDFVIANPSTREWAAVSSQPIPGYAWLPFTNYWGVRGFLSNTFVVEGDQPVPGDYDGDGIIDITIFRSTDGFWQMHPSSGSCPYLFDFDGRGCIVPSFGSAGAVATPGDIDGDGIADLIFLRNGEFSALTSGGGCPSTMRYGANLSWGTHDGRRITWASCNQYLGISGKPFVGSFGSDRLPALGAMSEAGVFSFVLRKNAKCPDLYDSSTYPYGFTRCTRYAKPWETSTVGDYDGDGITDFSVWTSAYGTVDGRWYLIPSSKTCPSNFPFERYLTTASSPSGAIPLCVRHAGPSVIAPVSGDFDGDGKSDTGWYLESTGAWGIVPSSNACPIHSTMLTLSHGSFNECILNFWGGPGYLPIQ